MYIVFLKLSDNKDQIGRYMKGHKDWIKRAFDSNVFLLAGRLEPELGGAIVAHNTSFLDLQRRISEDPYVANNVVSAEIIEIKPVKVEERLNFLLDNQV